MDFNKHFALEGRHAFLSPSKYHWVNYDDEKLDRVFITNLASQRGNDLHALAHEMIRLGVKLGRSNRTLNMYVNDALGFRMKSEVMLAYSENCFGTADTIKFDEVERLLRIHDLKTGAGRTSFKQLEVYVALFCLEYGHKPGDILVELRIYQNDEVRVHVPELDDIVHIMDRIITFDKRIAKIKKEVS